MLLANKTFRTLINPLFFFLNNLYCEMSSLFQKIFKNTPLVIKIRMTSKCNLSCSFCYLKEGLNKVESEVLSLSEWKKILAPLPKRTIIDITGAEPLCANDFIAFTQLLKDLKLHYSITTNGTVYNKDTAENLVKNNLSVLMISLDGLSNIHNKLRGQNNAFERTVRFIKDIEDAKKKFNKKTPLINIKSTVLDENHDELMNLVNFCNKEFNVDIYTFTLLFQSKSRGGIKLFEEFDSDIFKEGNLAKYKYSDKVYESLNNILKSKSKWPFPIVVKPRIALRDIKKYISDPSQMNVAYCPQYKNNITIYYDGKIAPCDIALNLGNVRDLDYKLENIFQTSKFVLFNKAMRRFHPVCQGCCSGMHRSK